MMHSAHCKNVRYKPLRHRSDTSFLQEKSNFQSSGILMLLPAKGIQAVPGESSDYVSESSSFCRLS
jgi:hypothetical protein